ncbi:HDOD domain-containing protein [bacterium]|nr:HDOD domain-containing protein [bacterium]
MENGENLKKIFNQKVETREELIQSIVDDLTKDNQHNFMFVRQLIQSMEQNKIEIPILPMIANKILQLSFNPNSDYDKYAQIVKSDTSIAVNVIKLANSPLYKGLRDINDLQLAISRIGIEGLKEIVLMLSLKMKIFNNKIFKIEFENTWKSSLLIALISSKVAEHYKISPSKAYTIGLLHDVGDLIFYNQISLYQSKNPKTFFAESFMNRISYSFHPKLSALALLSWGFPKEEYEFISQHHLPPKDNSVIYQKILYLAISLVAAKTIIESDYDEKSLFPYEFMIQQAKLNISAKILKEIFLKAIGDFEIIQTMFGESMK